MKLRNKLQVSFALWVVRTAPAQSLACLLKPSYPAPITADGWQAQLVAGGLSRPRSIEFDTQGGLLVVEQQTGIVHLKFVDGGNSCLEVKSKTYLVNDTSLNHGLALSNDGKTLYASSSSAVYAWSYDPSVPSLASAKQIMVAGMDSSGHTSRTLLMSQKEPGILVVSRGSNENIDVGAADIKSGRSQIRSFDLNNMTASSTPYDYATQGRLLGWGLRNSVGVVEEPMTGGIYSVENSADEIKRDGTDIHQNNPGEELNYHGFLNSSTEAQGGNYGYPYCFALWNTSIPEAGTLKTGDQFALEQNDTINDVFCAKERVSPRLTFQAHMAPLDIKFLPNGSEAFVTFHGSWDRQAPVGYKLSSIPFKSGSPIASPDSTASTTDIFRNPDNAVCPDKCVRPVGLALDDRGRVFMSSDSTGEIWLLMKAGEGAGVSMTTTGSLGPPSATATSKSTGIRPTVSWAAWMVIALGWVYAHCLDI